MRRVRKRWVALWAFVIVLLLNLSDLNGDQQTRTQAAILLAFTLALLVPRLVWRLAVQDKWRDRLGALHGGQLAILVIAALILCRVMLAFAPSADGLGAALWWATLVALASIVFVIPWLWFDSKNQRHSR